MRSIQEFQSGQGHSADLNGFLMTFGALAPTTLVLAVAKTVRWRHEKSTCPLTPVP